MHGKVESGPFSGCALACACVVGLGGVLVVSGSWLSDVVNDKDTDSVLLQWIVFCVVLGLIAGVLIIAFG